MVCPKCREADSQVIDSRDGPDSIRRRRECLCCHFRYTTHEKIENPPVIVVKKTGDRQRFDLEKIRKGVATSCKNRPVTSAMIDNLVNEVAQKVYISGREEISSQEVGTYVKQSLQGVDPIAYLRFTSVYQAFADIQQFEQEIHNIN